MEEKVDKIVFLKGKKVYLRPLNKQNDLSLCLQWINDQGLTQYLSMYLPSSKESEGEWFDNMNKSKNDIVLFIETIKNRPIGIIGLHKIDWKDRNAEHGIFIGEKDCWSKGYGKDAHMILLNYAFNTLNLHKICSSAVAFNERSLRYHLSCGYRIEGKRRKQVYKKGKYHDLVLFGLFQGRWEIFWEKYQKE
jgi:diamine N-acetyltransferase